MIKIGGIPVSNNLEDADRGVVFIGSDGTASSALLQHNIDSMSYNTVQGNEDTVTELDSINEQVHSRGRVVIDSDDETEESDYDEDSVQDLAHEDTEISVDEQVDRRAKRIDLKLARDYMLKYGYMDRDSTGLNGLRLEMMLEPHFKFFQMSMAINITGMLL